MKRYRGAKKRRSPAAIIMYGILFSAGLLIAFSLLAAFILSSMKDPTAKLKLFSLISLLTTAAVSGFLGTRSAGSPLMSMLSSGAFVALMLVISLITAKGAVGGGILMNYLCYILVAVFTAFLGKKKERRRRR